MIARSLLAAWALAMLALAPIAPAYAQQEEGDPIVEVESSDAKMNAAIAEANATLDEWLAVLENPPAGTNNIAFKFPLEGWEHIWVGSVVRDGDFLLGQLNNNPHADGWSIGDFVRVPLSDVSDWAYTDRNGYTHGHRTTRVLLDELDPAFAAEIRQSLGWD